VNCYQGVLLPMGFLESNTALPASDCSLEADENGRHRQRDRYAAYFGLLGADWKTKLAYCWAHQRRDFVNLGEGCQR